MSEMVERVARAMYARHFDEAKRPWELAHEDYRAPYLNDARVSIEAMREPTEAMHTAAYARTEKKLEDFEDEYWEVWQAMIDEALR